MELQNLPDLDIEFNIGDYDINKFTNDNEDCLSHKEGALYFAKNNKKSHLFYDDGEDFLEIIPRVLDIENGGTGATLLTPNRLVFGEHDNNETLPEGQLDYIKTKKLLSSNHYIDNDKLFIGLNKTNADAEDKFNNIFKFIVNGTSVFKTILPYDYYLPGTATNAAKDGDSGAYNLGSTVLPWNNLQIHSIDLHSGYNSTISGGRLYTTQSNNTTSQVSKLVLGNNLKTGNIWSRYGEIDLYNENGLKTTLRAYNSNNSNLQSIVHLPFGYSNTQLNCYLVWKSSGSASVGSTNQPVYFTASGRALACGAVGTAYGGTGVNSQTLERLPITTTYNSTVNTPIITTNASNHYANPYKIGINRTTEPVENFYVNGTSCFSNTVAIMCNTNATNLINGAFRVEGGAGIVGNLHLGSRLVFSNTSYGTGAPPTENVSEGQIYFKIIS